ncbi:MULTISPECIES: UDP-N-acetylglucosamine diphosphorylase [unclassified Lentimonas]|uniref:acyltransferase n=1 Tax=unclassified Lentimonas TaxID=2630993 RepID=UPI00132858F3|nr:MULTISPECIES: UDP-N-acetylglucosamine diphosphorylase [unclassified Lentimonas]CAA6678440.1 Glucosamine-1-phosphate N-acetyltransferase (EC [Lentimonas sp. CC4]CAA6685533.1 Glucosamine-1-phosphate N-acetyltransferase (EC [Lentimonas sp. CC6]CAA6689721.1 Glucosamine-1-phosphate N-acetyltransferase (EC [Lentimonas sp. CC19]CAA6690484.1 Glucosamine-1-phosphate N-acetyltransferase (EC [Lentimonas sp. CC10]CAA7068742.1 Glucosamine-1-phosphate N-acetyltransferase (EC [Lentimonas sp. CC11]
MLKASDLFEFPESLPFASVFTDELAPWLWVPLIAEALKAFEFEPLAVKVPAGLHIEGQVFIHPSVKLPPYGSIKGPAYIGAGTELRPGVFIRGNVIAGENCVLGNSCEFKNCLLLDGVQVPHFSYVGDSVLGNKAHLGAGVTCSNLRLDQANVPVQMSDGSRCDSGLRKLGALVGDAAEVGCNAVLNPGSILGRRALVMPTMAFRGTLGANSIAFIREQIKTAPRMD